jgi:hypothetical protein
MKFLTKWFVKEAPPERRSAERVLSPWLVAYDWSGSETKKHEIRDISTTGLYLLTEERWNPGEIVSIALRRKDQVENGSERAIPVQVRAVRWGANGVGLSFVQAKDMDMSIMESPMTPVSDRKEPEAVRRKLRMAKASAFVDQICPSISEDVKVLFRDRLSTFRVGNAIEIALKAEHHLCSQPDAARKRAHPTLVMRILEDGSWHDDEAIQELWAGLLIASCTDDGQDQSMLDFVALLSDIAAEHLQIFSKACSTATKVVSESGEVTAQPLFTTLDELRKVTNLHDVNRIDVDVDHLTVFGLFQKRNKNSSYRDVGDVEITPTSLGLELYARCHGYRGPVKDFYGVTHKGVEMAGK